MEDRDGQRRAREHIADRELAGDYAAALEMYEEQLRDAQSSGGQLETAGLGEAIGFLFAHQGAFSTALRHFDESHAIYASLDARVGVANNLINSADMLWRLGRYEAARDRINQANQEVKQFNVGNDQLSAKLPRVEAQMALSENRVDDALKHATTAIRLNGNTGHLAEAEATYGLALSRSGSTRQGLLRCEKAVNDAAKKDGWMLWDCNLALAESLLANRQFESARARSRRTGSIRPRQAARIRMACMGAGRSSQLFVERLSDS